MTITRKDLEQVARLAELAVDPAELPGLTAQLDRIVGMVAQLAGLDPAGSGIDRFVPGPVESPLRADEVHSARLAFPPAAIAPEFIDGFFVVPRLGAMEEET